MAAVLAEHEVTGLLEVTWTREETSRTRYVGRGRGGPDRPKKTEWTIRYQITTVRPQRVGDPGAGGPDGLAGPGHERARGTAVAGGFGGGVPGGLVPGA